MKTFVTVNFKYNNKNYLFYGNTRNEVKSKIDNWMKNNNVINRPSYNYETNTKWNLFKYNVIHNYYNFMDNDMNFMKFIYYLIGILIGILYFYFTYPVLLMLKLNPLLMRYFNFGYCIIGFLICYFLTYVFYTLLMIIYTTIDMKRNLKIY